MKRHLRHWGAMYVLVVAALLSMWLFGAYERMVVADEAAQHGQPYQPSEFWHRYWSGVFENLQSEFWQLVAQGLLLLGPMSLLLWQADQQADKTDVERLEAKLDRLLEGR
jgi:hypothetical protein